MTGWTEERRARQAQKIRQWQPWKRSTGPKTLAGKQKSSRNALKHGAHTAGIKAIRSYLQASGLLLRALAQKRKEWEDAQRFTRWLAKQKVLPMVGNTPLHGWMNSCLSLPRRRESIFQKRWNVANTNHNFGIMDSCLRRNDDFHVHVSQSGSAYSLAAPNSGNDGYLSIGAGTR